MKTEKIQEFRRRLLELRARLVREVNQLIESLPNEGQPVGEISHIPSHNADRDSDGVDKEVALVQNEEGLLEAVAAALARIEAGTFGTCEGCQGNIAVERLDALPYAPLCIACAQRGVQV
ncbi:MAG TPA: TraR/DksA C4-type zinc finger protein [Pirellulales bacterium]|jgi:RNA polymerase-binding protein DksA|nr:TraR/DksA C4-type zinc finger protein [Pirellulales bacterium]